MSEAAPLAFGEVCSPVGWWRVTASASGVREVRRVALEEPARTPRAGVSGAEAAEAVVAEAVDQLGAYFARKLQVFALPLALEGTAFQREVWAALCTIPYGRTCTYSEVAEQIGRPRAVRAVGAANGRNPVAIAVPCHRVLGRGGALTGYAGGLETKAWLLRLEGALLL